MTRRDSTPVDLASLRKDYARAGLEESDLDPDPITMFDRWLRDAVEADLYDANAMVVSAGVERRPALLADGAAQGPRRARVRVLHQHRLAQGRELAANGRCALLFPWHPLERQVRVEGRAVPLDRASVEAYFSSRPRKSRLGAWASHQSQEVAGRAELLTAYAAAEERFPDDVPVPEEWGGYVVLPEVVEFWQGRPGRMHDRLGLPPYSFRLDHPPSRPLSPGRSAAPWSAGRGSPAISHGGLVRQAPASRRTRLAFGDVTPAASTEGRRC